MQNLILTGNLVIPVFLIVALGYFLRRLELINDNFVNLSSKIVFSVSLPALVFFEVSRISLDEALDLKILIFVYAAVIISFIVVWFISFFIKDGKDKGSFIQGSFRGNYAIIGLALISNIFGTEKLGKASLILAFIIPLYSILSVIALTVPLRKEKKMNIIGTFSEILKNPLILAVIAAIPFSYFGWFLPVIVEKTVNYLAALTLPLALLGIGGFLNFNEIKKASLLAFLSTLIKIVIIPVLTIYIAVEMGFPSGDLGIIFILFACPTAIASFIMAEAMGANSKLAGNIVLITTLGSVLTITIGLFLLKEAGLI